MGQYHQVYNLTKRECISSRGIDCGAKLLEQCGPSGEPLTADAVFLLLANSNGRGGGDAPKHELIGRWAGDSLVVQGDYAEEGDPAFISQDDEQGFNDISPLVAKMLTWVFLDREAITQEELAIGCLYQLLNCEVSSLSKYMRVLEGILGAAQNTDTRIDDSISERMWALLFGLIRAPASSLAERTRTFLREEDLLWSPSLRSRAIATLINDELIPQREDHKLLDLALRRASGVD